MRLVPADAEAVVDAGAVEPDLSGLADPDAWWGANAYPARAGVAAPPGKALGGRRVRRPLLSVPRAARARPGALAACQATASVPSSASAAARAAASASAFVLAASVARAAHWAA